MSIQRAPRKKSNFTIIDNVIFDSELSFRAIGLLTYLLSKPDHWEVSTAQLVKVSKLSDRPDGRDSVYAIYKELISKGFMRRIDQRSEEGKMSGVDYIVYDSPLTDLPDAVKPNTEEDSPLTPLPDTAETTQVSTEVKVSTDVNNIMCGFDLFWNAGMRKVGSKKEGDG